MRPVPARRFMTLALVAGCVSVSAGACTKAQARTPTATPVPLAVPERPGRMHFPVTIEAPPPPESTEKPATPANPVRPKPTPTPTATPTPAPTPPPDPNPPPVVQTNSQAEHESQAKAMVAAADQNLSRVNWKALGREARAQYDSAQQFLKMARTALLQRNFLLARANAEKAATIAAMLVKG